MSGYELIPGTTLPIGDDRSLRPEGRGDVKITSDREPVQYTSQPGVRLDPAQLALVKAALATYDNKRRKLKTIYDTTARVSDASTGNLVVPLFTAPTGCECHVTQLLVDAPQSSSINPSNAASSASAWAFIAIVPGASSGFPNAQADSLRSGLVTFWPNPAVLTANPQAIIPVQETFNDKNAPVMFGGEMMFYVLHGGSIAAFTGITVQVTYRVEIYGYESGQLG